MRCNPKEIAKTSHIVVSISYPIDLLRLVVREREERSLAACTTSAYLSPELTRPRTAGRRRGLSKWWPGHGAQR